MQFKVRQIKREILRLVLNGLCKEGDALPTIREFARSFKVSPNRVQEAVHDLSRAGVIENVPRKGLFVKAVTAQAGRGNRIGLVVCENAKYIEALPYPGEVIDVLRRRLKDFGFELVVYSAGQQSTITMVENLYDMKLAGLALFEMDSDSVISELKELRLPMVSIDYDAHRLGVPSVVFDNAFGMASLVKSLAEMGHRQIALVTGVRAHEVGGTHLLSAAHDERIQGYDIGMRLLGFKPRIETIKIYNVKPHRLKQEDVLDDLVRQPPVPTALVCVENWIADRLCVKAQAVGLRVPEDVTIVGFGNRLFDVAPGRKIGTLAVDHAHMGEVAASLVQATARQTIQAAERVPITPVFTPNASVAAPRTRTLQAAAEPIAPLQRAGA